MGDKAKTPLAMCRLKLVDRIFRSVYCCHRVLLFMRDLVYIVGWAPNTLQNDGCFREFLNFLRKSLHCLLGPAGILLRYRFHSTAHPFPTSGLLMILIPEVQTTSLQTGQLAFKPVLQVAEPIFRSE